MPSNERFFEVTFKNSEIKFQSILIIHGDLLDKMKFLKIITLHTAVTISVNHSSTNPIKWSNTIKQFVDNFPTNCLSVFDHFVGLALKGLSRR